MSLLPTAEKAPVVGGAWHHKAVYMTQHLQTASNCFSQMSGTVPCSSRPCFDERQGVIQRDQTEFTFLLQPQSQSKSLKQMYLKYEWPLSWRTAKYMTPQVAAFALPVYTAICDRESDPLVLALFYWEKISLFCAYALCFVSVYL